MKIKAGNKLSQRLGTEICLVDVCLAWRGNVIWECVDGGKSGASKQVVGIISQAKRHAKLPLSHRTPPWLPGEEEGWAMEHQ